MDRYYQTLDHPKTFSDCALTAFTSLFLATKNCEVEPLCLGDIKNHFLNKAYSRQQILEKEMKIRHSTEWENEVPTLFEYVMLFSKLMKMGCQKQVTKCYYSTHRFLCDVESAAYDFCKSVLIDAYCLKFKPSFIVAAVFSATIELTIKMNKGEVDEQTSPILKEIQMCNKVWDNILASIFGRNNELDLFGRYIVYR